MADAWYILNRGQTLGPSTAEQLKQLARQGKLTPETQIAKEKDGPWVPAARIKGLFPEPAAAPPLDQEQPSTPPQEDETDSDAKLEEAQSVVPVDGDDNDNQIGDTKFCHDCGKKIRARAKICHRCGVRQPGGAPAPKANPMPRLAATDIDFLLFRRMVTPWLIIWGSYFLTGLLLLGGMGEIIKGSTKDAPGYPMKFIVFTMVIGPIFIRIFSEIIILFFRMNETLTDIANQQKHGKAV